MAPGGLLAQVRWWLGEGGKGAVGAVQDHLGQVKGSQRWLLVLAIPFESVGDVDVDLAQARANFLDPGFDRGVQSLPLPFQRTDWHAAFSQLRSLGAGGLDGGRAVGKRVDSDLVLDRFLASRVALTGDDQAWDEIAVPTQNAPFGQLNEARGHIDAWIEALEQALGQQP